MCNSLLVLFVIIFFQVFGLEFLGSAHHLIKRSPQQIDIQSISQKQISPDITVVDVVVNEPTRGRYPNQNPYVQPAFQPGAQSLPRNNYNYHSNGPYQAIPNRRQPEIQIIEVVDPTRQTGINSQQWQMYPTVNQGQFHPNNPSRSQQGQSYPQNIGRHPNRRPYRPNTDFHIQEDDLNDYTTVPTRRNRPGHRRRRPRPNKNQSGSEESSEDEKYIFDGGKSTVAGYTNENFPIIPLNKNDIRR